MRGRQSRETRRIVGAIGAAWLLSLIVGCSQPSARVKQVHEERVGDPILLAEGHAVDGLNLAHGELDWFGIRIGTRRAELERLLGAPFNAPDANEICSSVVSTRRVGEFDVTFEFADADVNAPLEHLFIPLAGEQPQSQQVERLKRLLEGSIYVPSRYAPELSENDNPKPVYRIATLKPRVVMLRHDEGLWLGDPRCYD